MFKALLKLVVDFFLIRIKNAALLALFCVSFNIVVYVFSKVVDGDLLIPYPYYEL